MQETMAEKYAKFEINFVLLLAKYHSTLNPDDVLNVSTETYRQFKCSACV